MIQFGLRLHDAEKLPLCSRWYASGDLPALTWP